MGNKSIEVFIEPQVLIWARKTRGKSIGDVAKRIGKNEDFVKELESGQRKIRLRQLEVLANYYKRPLAAFFLSQPPFEPPPPRDHRTFPDGERKKEFSEDTLLAIRKAQLLQDSATELALSLGYEIKPRIDNAKISSNPNNIEALATRERNRLGVSVLEQSRWIRNYGALNEWKKRVENLGILVFQISMPPKETRGFSLTGKGIPTIILNSKEHPNARIFSLFHEYAHLLLNEGGICDMKYHNHTPVEIFCNHFAGSFLVPRKALLEHEIVKNKESLEWSQQNIEDLAAYFK
ncbi:ImmA/IrrE family metallo-endopeptidase, partial [candidate division WOR-3 bacterium]|nr:ImmA/IrrE family metallo-endopeptidase [candidate division WOR-3 bacterium]